MRDFSNPAPGVPFLTGSAAQSLDQMHDRLLYEADFHERSGANCLKGAEPNVELTIEEARIMAGNLTRAAHLLRMASEGLI
jgi:hypothetical protein